MLVVCSRRVVGWAIDSSSTAALTTNVLGMAIDDREPSPGTMIHSEHGVQGRRNWSSQHLDHEGVRWDVRGSKYLRCLRGRDSSGRRIASNVTTVEAAQAVGVSWPVGSRWFRHVGGMSPIILDKPTGRYLSFPERQEIALLHAQDFGVQEISRRIGRDPGTISRELCRNAATRDGKQEYRALVAQWKIQQAAKRPKTAKLVENDRLHEYVRKRLVGSVRRSDGTIVPGPRTPAWKGMNEPQGHVPADVCLSERPAEVARPRGLRCLGWRVGGDKPPVKNCPALGNYSAVVMNTALRASMEQLPEQLRKTLTWAPTLISAPEAIGRVPCETFIRPLDLLWLT